MTNQKSGTADLNAYKRRWAKTKGAESRRKSRKKWQQSESYEQRRAIYRERHAEYLKTEAGKRAKRRGRGQPEPTRQMPGRCECCGLSELVFKKGLFLDHCHTSGKFRGWICDNCNLGIGRLGDDIEGVRNALRYLEKYG